MIDLLSLFSFILLYAILITAFFWLFIYLDVGSKRAEKIRLDVYPTLAIIVPTINEGKFLKKCVDSALKLAYPKSRYTIYIALNKSSTQETAATAASFKNSRVKLVRCGMNGKARVMNYVIDNFVKEELLMVLDADTVLERRAAERLVPFFKNKNVGCAVASVQVLDPKTIAEKLQKYEYLLSFISRKMLSSMAALMVAHGAGTVFRTSIVRKVGRFDENNNPTEDLEMGIKILTNGYQIETDPRALSYTVVPKTFPKLFEQRKRWSSGFLFNVIKYRKEFFKKSNARLGFFVLPLLFFSMSIGIILLFMLFSAVLYPFASFVYDEYQYIANTSISFVISSQFNALFFNVTSQTIFSIVTTVVGLFTIFYALRYSGARMDKVRDLFGILAYILFYLFFLSFVWLYTAIAFAITGRGYTWKTAT